MLRRVGRNIRRRSSLFAGFYNYTVFVQTGNHPRAGTDSKVFIVLHGQDGQKSPETKLSVLFRDDFDRGNLDKFKIKYQPFAVLAYIELWLGGSGFKKEWFVESIMVVNRETKVTTVFPIFRWLRPNYRFTFYPLDTSLPQLDPVPSDQRRTELEEKRASYQLFIRAPGLPPQLKSPLPLEEQPPPENPWDLAKIRVKISVTTTLARLTMSSWKSIDDVKNVFTKTLPPPSVIDRWNDDRQFGLQRLAGVNNSWVQVCRIVPENFAVTEDMVNPFLEGLSLTRALSDRRIFLVNHAILQNVPTKEDCHLCAPMALFFEDNTGSLKPIAIQLFQDAADDNPVFLPSDPEYTWALAKMWFNNADSCMHLTIAHFGFAHALMEGIAVTTNRNLSQSHPMFKLLAPHFYHSMAVNQRLYEKLISPEAGWLEDIMGIGTNGFEEIIRRYNAIWRLDLNGLLPADLRTRGVFETDILKQYYFREDAMALWEVIELFVSKYVKLYYDVDDKIIEDSELQNWRQEMTTEADHGGLGIYGVPGEMDKFTSRAQVTSVCAFIIYTCSVAHAAVCFKQYDEYAFPPNYPAMLLGEPPRDKTPRQEQDILNALPGRSNMVDALTILKLLSERHTKPMGEYEMNLVYDPEGIRLLEDFKQNLRALSATLKIKNRIRVPPYPFLDPCEIPNSMIP